LDIYWKWRSILDISLRITFCAQSGRKHKNQRKFEKLSYFWQPQQINKMKNMFATPFQKDKYDLLSKTDSWLKKCGQTILCNRA